MFFGDEESFLLEVIFDVVVEGCTNGITNNTPNERILALRKRHEVKVREYSQHN